MRDQQCKHSMAHRRRWYYRVRCPAAAQQLSRGEGVTLFMTLLAVFQTLLYRYTGQADINIGTPIANRNRAETEEADRVLREHARDAHEAERRGEFS
jgi:hypothetical protein